MFLRRLALAAMGAALLSSPTQAQQAEAAGGPLRESANSDGSRNMIVLDPPKVRPTGPVEAWEWIFYRNERSVDDLNFDTAAYRIRIDCQAGTREVLGGEIFKDGKHLPSPEYSEPAETPPPGTLSHGAVRMACEPGLAAGKKTYPDHRAARAAADAYFAANP